MNRRQRLRRRRIRNATIVVPVGVALLMWSIGLLLPVANREEVRTVLPASALAVWAVLTDLDGMPDWRRGLHRLERLPDAEGQVRWLELQSGGRLTQYQWVELISPSRLVVESAELRRRWVYQVRPLDQGSELSVVEERKIANPLARTLVRLFGSDRNRLQGLTSDLGRRLAGRRNQIAAEPTTRSLGGSPRR